MNLVWRKELPDVPGMWLAAFYSNGRWWLETLKIIRIPAKPKRANSTWWYMGPIILPEKKV